MPAQGRHRGGGDGYRRRLCAETLVPFVLFVVMENISIYQGEQHAENRSGPE